MNPNVSWRQLGDIFNTLGHGSMYLTEGHTETARRAFLDVIEKLEKIREEQGGIFASFQSLAEAEERMREEGPLYHDGHDHEGYPGGCERFGHAKESCPEKPNRDSIRIKDIRSLLEMRNRMISARSSGNEFFFEALQHVLKD